jgi:hypothetical protein
VEQGGAVCFPDTNGFAGKYRELQSITVPYAKLVGIVGPAGDGDENMGEDA